MQEGVQVLVMDLAVPEAMRLLAPLSNLGIPGEAMGFSDLEPERHPDPPRVANRRDGAEGRFLLSRERGRARPRPKSCTKTGLLLHEGCRNRQ